MNSKKIQTRFVGLKWINGMKYSVVLDRKMGDRPEKAYPD